MIWKRVCVIAGLCSLVVPLWAQTNSWQELRKLGRGTPISVRERARRGCELVEVDDFELTCQSDIGQVTRRLVFERDRVREVRLEMPDDNHMVAGAIAGAVFGGLVGWVGGQQSRDPEARGYARVYGAPLGAAIGGVAGSLIHAHGAVVYRK